MLASVLIPTRNRRESLLRTLRSLRAQSIGEQAFEIVVAFDRCNDGSAEAVAREFPRVRTTIAPRPGPSSALNAAARIAAAPLLIFLDDDMEPVPGFVAAHVAAHRHSTTPVAFAGRIIPVVVTPSVFSRDIDAFYRSFDAQLAGGELVSSPHGLPGGNSSIATDDFRAVGGIDERYEFMKWDFELAARLLERGFRLGCASEAAATTYLQLDDEEMLSRAAKRAASDVRLAREHPWCVPFLEIHRAATRTDFRGDLFWNAAGLLQFIAAAMRRVLPNNTTVARAEMASRYWRELRRQLGDRSLLRGLARDASEFGAFVVAQHSGDVRRAAARDRAVEVREPSHHGLSAE